MKVSDFPKYEAKKVLQYSQSVARGQFMTSCPFWADVKFSNSTVIISVVESIAMKKKILVIITAIQ